MLKLVNLQLLRFLMRRVLAAEAAILRELEPLARLLLVLGRAVVAPLALVARQRDDVSHWTKSLIIPKFQLPTPKLLWLGVGRWELSSGSIQ